MKHILFVKLFTLAFATQAIAADPFGLVMGTPLAELDSTETGAKIFLESVPKPHPDFEFYFGWGSAASGLCLVTAISKEYDNDAFGFDVRSAFGKFLPALEKRYGPSTPVDFLRSGSIWDEPRDWVMSIRQNERVYGAYFDQLSTSPDGTNLSGLEIGVVATGSNESVLKLTYQFSNFEACVAEIEEQENDSF